MQHVRVTSYMTHTACIVCDTKSRSLNIVSPSVLYRESAEPQRCGFFDSSCSFLSVLMIMSLSLSLSQRVIYYKCHNLVALREGAQNRFFAFLLTGGLRPPDPSPLDPRVHILPIFQISYGPYDPYITRITNIIWTVRFI